MANSLTGDILTPEHMAALESLRDNPFAKAVRKNIVEITPEQYKEMEGMTREQRIKYLGKKRCHCGSRKKAAHCCGVVLPAADLEAQLDRALQARKENVT